MASREEIREGIANLFMIARQEGSLRKWADGKADADEVLSYLHSQGVAIKVDRELPEVGERYKDFGGNDTIWEEAQQDMLKAVYVAVEPLIKE